MKIEVERKFLWTEETEAQLNQETEFKGEFLMEDIYYDNEELTLTTADIWLRLRDGKKWQCKFSVQNGNTSTSQFLEVTDEDSIQYRLQLPGKTLQEALEKAQIRPFAVISTKRKKYFKNPFIIVLDTTASGYRLGEVELIVSQASETNSASQIIEDFMKSLQLPLHEGDRVHSKLLEFIYKERRTHYQKLSDSGILDKRK